MFNENEIPQFQRPFTPSKDTEIDTSINFPANSILNNISFQKLLDWLDECTEGLPIVESFARRFNVTRGHIAAIFSAILILYFIFGWKINIFCNTIGLVYPAFKSHKVLLIHRAMTESPKATATITTGGKDKENDTNPQMPTCLNGIQGEIMFWLRYWIVYSLYLFISILIFPLISWLPLISIVRVGFILYLYHPYTRVSFRTFVLWYIYIYNESPIFIICNNGVVCLITY